ncbi:ABC-type transport auxiliary lipoprotein family protein [Luteibacter sp. CQ10]|uniref:ABC-type transport auxiliary lipoprotein family protein n=1 Tax=Luteibacter sp. CQ10 TaxID=2805821 RepID=UPI0034A344BD
MKRALVALPLLGLLTACSILPKQEASRTYTLPAAPGARPRMVASVDWGLRVMSPGAPRTIDNPRIAVSPEANTMTVYAGARWSDTVPHLFRDRLADAFRDSGRIAALSTDEANLAADYELGGNLAAFQTDYVSGKPEVTIRYDAVVSDSRHHIAGSRRFEVREPVQGKEVPQVVEAFGRAMDRLSGQVVGWTFEAIPATR